MSRKVSVVELIPPENSGGSVEKIESEICTCPSCNGRGIFIDKIGYDNYSEKKCSVCSGSGLIKAIVTINWIDATRL